MEFFFVTIFNTVLYWFFKGVVYIYLAFFHNFFFYSKIYFSTLIICYMIMYILESSKTFFCLFLSKSGEDMAA